MGYGHGCCGIYGPRGKRATDAKAARASGKNASVDSLGSRTSARNGCVAEAGGDGIGLPGVYRAWDADASWGSEAVLRGADVPAGEAAEGEIQAVLSDWGGGAGEF